MLQRICADDTEVLDLIDRVVQGKHAGNGSNQYASANVDNINISTHRPAGTNRQHALRKLRKDSPTLHAEVLAGKLSPHAAMVKAGFRPKTFTVVHETKACAETLNEDHTSSA